MAGRDLDLSSEDEYELMTPQTITEKSTNPIALSHHYTRDKRTDSTQNWGSVPASSSRLDHQREDVFLKRKKKFFGKSKSKDKDQKPLTKSSSFSARKGIPVITSPTVANINQIPSQILILDGPPKVSQER